jgi:hypothetical protein
MLEGSQIGEIKQSIMGGAVFSYDSAPVDGKDNEVLQGIRHAISGRSPLQKG